MAGLGLRPDDERGGACHVGGDGRLVLPRRRRQSRAHAVLQQSVPGGVVLDLVDTSARRVVRAEGRRVPVDELGPPRCALGAGQSAEVAEPLEVLAGPVAPRGLDERQVGAEEVEVDRGRDEVESVVAVGHERHRSDP
jgi:hypothetical protein